MIKSVHIDRAAACLCAQAAAVFHNPPSGKGNRKIWPRICSTSLTDWHHDERALSGRR